MCLIPSVDGGLNFAWWCFVSLHVCLTLCGLFFPGMICLLCRGRACVCACVCVPQFHFAWLFTFAFGFGSILLCRCGFRCCVGGVLRVVLFGWAFSRFPWRNVVLCLVVLLSCGVKLFAIDLSSSRLGLLHVCGFGEAVVVGVV